MKHYFLMMLAMSLLVFTSCGEDDGPDPDPDPDPDPQTCEMTTATVSEEYLVGTWDISNGGTITFNAELDPATNSNGTTSEGSFLEWNEGTTVANDVVYNYLPSANQIQLIYVNTAPAASRYLTIDAACDDVLDLDELGVDVVLTRQ